MRKRLHGQRQRCPLQTTGSLLSRSCRMVSAISGFSDGLTFRFDFVRQATLYKTRGRLMSDGPETNGIPRRRCRGCREVQKRLPNPGGRCDGTWARAGRRDFLCQRFCPLPARGVSVSRLDARRSTLNGGQLPAEVVVLCSPAFFRPLCCRILMLCFVLLCSALLCFALRCWTALFVLSFWRRTDQLRLRESDRVGLRLFRAGSALPSLRLVSASRLCFSSIATMTTPSRASRQLRPTCLSLRIPPQPYTSMATSLGPSPTLISWKTPHSGSRTEAQHDRPHLQRRVGPS